MYVIHLIHAHLSVGMVLQWGMKHVMMGTQLQMMDVIVSVSIMLILIVWEIDLLCVNLFVEME